MKEILITALKNKNIISFCIGKVDWDKRKIGYVKSINKENVLVSMVDIFGGIVSEKSIKINNITILEINDSYNMHLERLRGHGEVIRKTKTHYYFNKGNGFIEKVKALQSKKSVCTVFFETEFLTGIIKEINEIILIINTVGYRGTKEGESYCKIDNVTKIRYEGPLESKISYLRKVK
jgi:hypothetical protein